VSDFETCEACGDSVDAGAVVQSPYETEDGAAYCPKCAATVWAEEVEGRAASNDEIARLRGMIGSLDIDGKRLGIVGPEDAAVAALCGRWGYGAVMDAAYRLWRRIDPVGAMLVGPCVAVAQDAMDGSGDLPAGGKRGTAPRATPPDAGT